MWAVTGKDCVQQRFSDFLFLSTTSAFWRRNVISTLFFVVVVVVIST